MRNFKQNSKRLAGYRAGVALSGLAVAAICQQGAAWAQTAKPTADEAEASNAEIIVQARRRDEASQNVPLVVNTVTSDSIAKLNIRRFEEVTNLVPGLALTANANGIGSSSSLRGTNHDVNVSGENGTIQYYLNDAPVQSGLVLQAMYDIGQIDVLRGP